MESAGRNAQECVGMSAALIGNLCDNVLAGGMPAVQTERLDPVNITPVEVVHRRN